MVYLKRRKDIFFSSLRELFFTKISVINQRWGCVPFINRIIRKKTLFYWELWISLWINLALMLKKKRTRVVVATRYLRHTESSIISRLFKCWQRLESAWEKTLSHSFSENVLKDIYKKLRFFLSLYSGFNERLELFVTFKELRCVHTDHNETVIVTSCD